MGGGFVSTLADFQSRTARIIKEETRIRPGKLRLQGYRLQGYLVNLSIQTRQSPKSKYVHIYPRKHL